MKRKLIAEPKNTEVKIRIPLATIKEPNKIIRFYHLVFKNVFELGEFLQSLHGLEGVEIRSIMVSSNDSGIEALALLIFSGKKAAEDFINLAKSMNISLNESHVEYGKVVISGFHVVLESAKSEGLLVSKNFMRNVAIKARETFGATGEAFLYHIGYQVGVQAYKDYWSRVIGQRRELLRAFLSLIRAQGWLREYEVIEYQHGRRAVIRLKGLFEANSLGRPACHFTRGIISGLIAAFWGKHVVSKEDPCQPDPSCCIVEVVTLG